MLVFIQVIIKHVLTKYLNSLTNVVHIFDNIIKQNNLI